MKGLTVSNIDERSFERDSKGIYFEKVDANDSNTYLFFKRLIDVLGSLVGILILSPLFILIALLIKVEDPKGSIFFKQTRLGENENPFYMFKFRSMVANAEELKATLIKQNEAEGPVFKIKKDPRVTKLGSFIRKTSIDELPQLFNVLKGEMSLVGPRPPLPIEVKQYSEHEKQRLKVTPGLTCYWQVSGRSNIGFNEWVELDLKYIRDRSLIIDMKLILRTIFVLFGSKNAY